MRTLLLLIAFSCLSPLPAVALSVTVNMTGTINHPGGFPPPPTAELQGVAPGDAVLVTLSYDPVTSQGSIRATVPSRQVTFDASSNLVLYIERELISGRADFMARAELPNPSRSLFLSVLDPTGQAFAAPDLPTSAAAFSGLRFGLSYDSTPSFPIADPTIPLFTAGGVVTAVPEPSTAIWLIALAGLAAIDPIRGAARWKTFRATHD